jgi:hypothetical protein
MSFFAGIRIVPVIERELVAHRILGFKNLEPAKDLLQEGNGGLQFKLGSEIIGEEVVTTRHRMQHEIYSPLVREVYASRNPVEQFFGPRLGLWL